LGRVSDAGHRAWNSPIRSNLTSSTFMSSRPKSLSGEAVQFYKSGQPFLQHNLPFWMASLVGHLLVLLIPIVAVLYPMMRFLPALYGWLMRRKIARLYGELRLLEDEITGGGPTDAAQLMARLDQLEKQANQLRMPIAYESMMYLLRNHIGVVRNRLAAGQP
jgi:hypothetical protein